MTLVGYLIAFEGLDQSGKQTQAERLAAALQQHGRTVHALSFPDYGTAIGSEIGQGLAGGRDYPPDVMQLLYVANRSEYRQRIEQWMQAGDVVVCDRYLASTIAYGEALGLERSWLIAMQAHMPAPSLTLLLDIPPAASLARKQRGRDRYEQDLALLSRVRDSYLRQAEQIGWICIDAAQSKDAVTKGVVDAIRSRLGLL